ncbi:hypothetical protein H4R34_002975 [Dimargaris verticillata]|uniref:Uncharacterized protein n=1 Tax=Dimargaris verticillata TaxID=2761393 RepID=A0A9W8B1R7_9FUNG|nr:hypothetical protein H4R34_002975 [Dimargaris verticillata]
MGSPSTKNRDERSTLSVATTPQLSVLSDTVKSEPPSDSSDAKEGNKTQLGADTTDANADPPQKSTFKPLPSEAKVDAPSNEAAKTSDPCVDLPFPHLVRGKVAYYAIDVETCPCPYMWSSSVLNLRQFAWAKFGTGCKKIFGKYYVMSDSLKKMGQQYEPTDHEFVSMLRAQVDTQLRVMVEFQKDMQKRIKEGKRVVVIGPYIAALREHLEHLNVRWDPSVEFLDIGLFYNTFMNRDSGSYIFLPEAMATMGLSLFSTRNAGTSAYHILEIFLLLVGYENNGHQSEEFQRCQFTLPS